MIPVAEPLLGQEEIDLVTDTIKSGWISSKGAYIDEFEKKFANFCECKYGVATSNGTTAIHLALAALGIDRGDEVIVPAMTFVATANPVSYTGATPIFVDSEFDTWNIDPEKIKEKITRRTKAIIPVHLYGHPANMKEIMNIAHKYGLLVIEDAAEAHGALCNGKRVGSIGDAGCFSFFANKVITTGEGGMIVTNNHEFVEKARILRDHGASKRRKYHHPWLGYNYRLTNIQAALGVAQFNRIEAILKRKREIASLYTKYLKKITPTITLPPQAAWAKNIYWMYSILINGKGKTGRAYLMTRLKKKGVETRPFFFPIHRLKRFGLGEHLPVAEYLGNTGVNLPSSATLTDDQVKYISRQIIDVMS